MKSFACLVIFPSLPVQIVLLVTIAKVGKDLSNHTNLNVFIGSLRSRSHVGGFSSADSLVLLF